MGTTTTTISIRDVPQAVRDALADQAARCGLSMQQYLLGELERLAAGAGIERWLEGVREQKAYHRRTVHLEQILAARDGDRP